MSKNTIPLNIFTFKSKVWLYKGPTAWHFVTLPKQIAATIKKYFDVHKKGWGSLPVSITFKEITWNSSIFPDRKSGSYLLPLKSEIRKSGKIVEGDTISLTLVVRI